MDISDINESLENMALPAETKKAILQLIDIKIDNDMKEVISEIRELKGEIKTNNDKIQVILWVVGVAMAVMVFMFAKK
jgi:hypothetical protein